MENVCHGHKFNTQLEGHMELTIKVSPSAPMRSYTSQWHNPKEWKHPWDTCWQLHDWRKKETMKNSTAEPLQWDAANKLPGRGEIHRNTCCQVRLTNMYLKRFRTLWKLVCSHSPRVAKLRRADRFTVQIFTSTSKPLEQNPHFRWGHSVLCTKESPKKK